ncbi:formate/nitrite transporter family protein [uncultured Clostridium sp.]|uniref:formate/nitrite transporter family protein n=1 Tax=uncultured Clostridium sp. TaxID=59620 RepID=UPI0025EC20DD|nr:formate/nitrite transporter family protein [uncultured Clostridium sp.]
MYYSDLNTVTTMAENKSVLSKDKPLVYLGRSAFTGILLFLATVLSYTNGAILAPNYPEFAKISCSALFCFAIIAIVFFNGELFTGNNFVMFTGLLDKKASIYSTLRVWIYSLLGNALGIIFFAYIFVKSGASLSILKPYLEPIVQAKMELSPIQVILRGILCNFSVCLAVFSGIKLKSEFGKALLMFFCVFTFVVAGFEHSIANIAIFSIAGFSLDSFNLALALNNILWAVTGNIIGGGIFLGGILKFTSIDG